MDQDSDDPCPCCNGTGMLPVNHDRGPAPCDCQRGDEGEEP